MKFWNFSSRDEFQGKSPQEIDNRDIGPQERELSQDLMNYVLSKINPYEFSDQNEINKEVKRCQERWLREPQEELNYKTPWEAILEERKRLGNPRKDFSILMDIAPINYNIHKWDDLSNIKIGDVPLVKDLEAFVNYFMENHIKVTVKNRWIP